MFKTIVSLLVFVAFSNIFSQQESVNPYHPVYNYLLKKQTEGALPMSAFFYRPISRKNVTNLLRTPGLSESNLSIEKSNLFTEFFDDTNRLDNYSSLGLQTDLFGSYLASDKNSYFFFYEDSLVSIKANPIFNYKFGAQSGDSSNRYTSLTSFGGHLTITYSDWLLFYLSVRNGIQSGDRKLAKMDERIKHSFTHQVMGLENFDWTDGYVHIEKEHFAFRFGRERLMWGGSSLNRIGFDSSSQAFDYLSIVLRYGKFDYRFMHGWLVEVPDTTFSPTTGVASTYKNPKFVAYSRLGFAPTDDISIGGAQTIIYSNRPFEAAYLNPFILWESAQRSLNDLDNSFWTFDINWRLFRGIVWNGTIMFDDINFNYLLKGDWSTTSNSAVYQTGLRLSNPLLPKNSLFEIEYSIVRPYAFSHYGLERPLSYTNNGFQLGLGIPPNSTCLTLSMDYDLTSRLNVNLRTDIIKHGENTYDSDGNIIHNVGGNVFYSKTLISPYYSYLLDGILEKEIRIKTNFTYLFSNHITFQLLYEFYSLKSQDRELKKNTVMLGLNFY